MKSTPFFIVCFLLLYTPDSLGQPEGTQYTEDCFYFELLGQGFFYSINYEHRFGEMISGRIGYTSWSEPDTKTDHTPYLLIAYPMMMNYLTERGNHHLELGLGIIAVQVRTNGEDIVFGRRVKGGRSFILGTGTVGYRYQPLRHGTLFRIGLAPIIGGEEGVVLLPCLSIGYAF